MAPEPARRVLTLRDGARTELRVVLAAQEASPAVLVLPAMGIAARYYDPLLDALAREGIHAAALDLRGIGASSVRAGRRVDFGYDALVDDTLAALDAVNELAPARTAAGFVGHSLGGHVALLAAARERRARIDGVALVASGSPWAGAWPARRALGMRALARAVPVLSAPLGYFPGRTLGFGGREARTLMREWARVITTNAFPGDAWAPASAVDALVAKVPRAKVERDTYDASPRLDHNRWPRTPAWFAPRLARFFTAF